MTLLIAQIGDIHIQKDTDPILKRGKQLANCIAAECNGTTTELLFLFTGDYTQTADSKEFELAKNFLQTLVFDVSEKTPIEPKVLTIPGNHDQNLSGDQAARDKVLASLTAEDVESTSIQQQILNPLENYWQFATEMHAGFLLDWKSSPFFNRVTFTCDGKVVQLQLFNSAWMSKRNEKTDSLYYPLDKITRETIELTPYVITAIHHPMNWFRQPDVMRDLRARIESTSDLVVTAHEHANDHYGKVRDKGLFAVDYLEGGVLQERSNKDLSTFNILKFDFQNDKFSLQRFGFANGIYCSFDDNEPKPIPVNRASGKTLLTPTHDYADFLQRTNLPISNQHDKLLSHQDIFTYPDLREQDQEKPDNPWTRLKGDRVSDAVRNGSHCLIASDAMGGKTSLAKQLCLDSIAENRIAVFLKCEESSKIDNPDTARKWISKQAEEQYGKDSLTWIVQNELKNTFVVIDDFHQLKRTGNQPELVLQAATQIFGTVCVTVDTDYLMEESRRAGRRSATVARMRKLQICEFGYVKIEDLTRRWLTIWTPGGVDDQAVRKVCNTIEHVLRINAMAHHPWVLIVLLQEATSSTDLAAKNGSYGFLYQAVITCALAKSKTHLDIKSKYTYLSEFAFSMYSKNVATYDLDQIREFHEFHYKKYRIKLDFEDTLTDFDSVGILRMSSGSVSFRDKYSYWFFVSWYLSENIHDDRYTETVAKLCSELHHEDSANILVFLSHFSNHPAVIESILKTARSLLGEYTPAELDTKTDLKVLDLMGVEEMKLSLPTTDPEENHRRMLEQKDEELALHDPSDKDGRSVVPTAPEPPEDEFQQIITKLRASLRAIDILGQVLRNGVGGIRFERKLEIVAEVYLLARRLNGLVIHDLPLDIPRWSEALNERFHEQHAGDSIVQRIYRITSHIVGSLSFLSYALGRRVSHALAHENLEEVFDEAIKIDKSYPTRIFDLSLRLDHVIGIPVNKTLELFQDLKGNVIGRNAVRALIANYLYLHRVDYQTHQKICQLLDIEYDTNNLNPAQKKTRNLPAPNLARRS